MTSKEKEILINVLFNRTVLKQIEPAEYVKEKGTLGGSAENEVKDQLRKEYNLLSNVQRFISNLEENIPQTICK